ncbi:hypothetical protein VNO77_38895 [Canavalia gladiata]|uniref:Uncharacterized protein n=1 Tax=Canavalia gladiata TaxID=3824 RepID=A0AAN9PWM9_CANGL
MRCQEKSWVTFSWQGVITSTQDRVEKFTNVLIFLRYKSKASHTPRVLLEVRFIPRLHHISGKTICKSLVKLRGPSEQCSAKNIQVLSSLPHKVSSAVGSSHGLEELFDGIYDDAIEGIARSAHASWAIFSSNGSNGMHEFQQNMPHILPVVHATHANPTSPNIA